MEKEDRDASTKRNLQVIFEDVQFSKDFNYFLTVQLNGDGEKRRTDVSSAVNNPIFSANTFYLPITDQQLNDSSFLHFTAFIALNTDQSQTNAG